jgi:excisionase family DNA binding protein
MKRYLTVKEVANELEYSTRAILSMIKQGAIPAIRLKKQRIRVKRSWLDKILADIPTEKEYKQAQEDIRFNADNQPKTINSTPVIVEPENNIEVKEDMTKKKIVESGNTEIVASKPRAKAFIPNPKKRIKKAVKKEVIENEPEYENESDNELNNDMADNDNSNNNNDDKDFLGSYKGIGNYD